MNKPTQTFKGPAGHRKRLRERFLNAGSSDIADYELLELLLTYSIPRIDTKPIAKALLNTFGSIIRVFQQRREWLLQVDGIGPQTALTELAPMVREIAWSHNVSIMARCRDSRQREFYLRMTAKYGWTKNVLALRIQDQTYEKTLLGQTNFEKTLHKPVRNQTMLAVRDEYTLDFLDKDDLFSYAFFSFYW